jgi:hypothetical protein
MDQLAPIIDRAQTWAHDSDCQPTYFCLGDGYLRQDLTCA